MSNNSEEQITKNVLNSMTRTLDPRLKQVMSSLISHIHTFFREVELIFLHVIVRHFETLKGDGYS